MMRILITGAGGFIGKALVQQLIKESKNEIFATGRKAASTIYPDLKTTDHLTIIDNLDLSREKTLHRLPDNLDYVIHAAAIARFDGASAQSLYQSNVLATDNLLNHVKKTSKSSLQRFIFISTFGVHDRPRQYDDSEPINETSPLAAVSLYGRSKQQAEKIVESSELPFVTLRLPWVYGPAMRKSSHIRALAKMFRNRSPVTKFDFPGRFSVAYIDDLTQAITQIMFKPQLKFQTYLVAHQTPVSFGELFCLLSEHFDGPQAKPLFKAPWLMNTIKLLAPYAGMKLRSLVENYYVCDASRLSQESITLTTSFKEGLAQSIKQGQWKKD